MPASNELFIKMSEEEYSAIPQEIRERHLSSKVVSQTSSDFKELMQDELYAKLHKDKKAITKDLNDRQFQLREKRRNDNANR